MSSISSLSRRPGRPRTNDVDSRQRLLAAALSAFSELGFEGASLRTIAVNAGFDAAMIFHRFGSKEKLWQAVVEAKACDFQVSLANELQPLLQGNGSLAERVTQVLDLFVDRLLAGPEISMLILREMPYPSSRRDFLVEKLIRPSCEHLVPFWHQAMEAGLLRRSDPVVFQIGIFGALSMILASRPILSSLGAPEMDLAVISL